MFHVMIKHTHYKKTQQDVGETLEEPFTQPSDIRKRKLKRFPKQCSYL